MASKREVVFVFNRLMKSQSFELLRLFNDANAGIGAVFRILKESEMPVSARKISEAMRVSEARVAVLLRKMQKRGYVTRGKDDKDARVTIIKLTKKGEAEAANLRNILCENIANVVDAIGFEKIEQYVKLTEEINDAIKNHLPSPPEIK